MDKIILGDSYGFEKDRASIDEMTRNVKKYIIRTIYSDYSGNTSRPIRDIGEIGGSVESTWLILSESLHFAIEQLVITEMGNSRRSISIYEGEWGTIGRVILVNDVEELFKKEITDRIDRVKYDNAMKEDGYVRLCISDPLDRIEERDGIIVINSVVDMWIESLVEDFRTLIGRHSPPINHPYNLIEINGDIVMDPSTANISIAYQKRGDDWYAYRIGRRISDNLSVFSHIISLNMYSQNITQALDSGTGSMICITDVVNARFNDPDSLEKSREKVYERDLRRRREELEERVGENEEYSDELISIQRDLEKKLEDKREELRKLNEKINSMP